MSIVTLEQLTTSTVDGSGVFDKLMQAVEAHIDQEFKKNRIKGPEYATVYLGALQSTLDQSIQFLLNKDEATIKAKQLELMDAQIAEINARTGLLQQQATNAGKEGLVLDKQVDKLAAEILLIANQDLKTVAETALLEQKTETELAQVSGTLSNGMFIAENSVLGRQIQLYKNQAAGFLRDAEQRAAKIMTETFSVRHSMDANGTPATINNKLTDAYIGQAITKLLQGIEAPG
ncbi:hypothetical protein [Marinobacter shengliensis]|uniref:hypothetical protein n=1 Tax=Marinobacter shengliensis TaxID=1389223 RepID=UPI001E4B7007|nr:hypothetical protein [Marinobacter shengliensis]MCD1628468.1 hypothetical protein [Marinobacter shengliensis]